nr:LysR substrate-binding domain-containing protein [Oharaeibacter diazotrophicus]
MPPLSALRAFEAVARLGSVRKAAEELGVDHSAVARHVRNLEAAVGVRLIDTGTRGSTPTPEGRRYAEQAALAFDVLAAATAALRPAGKRGELQVWCAPGLAVRWLMPRLAEIERLIPDREIVLRPTDQAPDLSRGEADVEIRFGPREAAGVRGEALIAPRFFPAASPAFLAGRPPVGSLADLAALPLVHEETREQWRSWLAGAGLDPVPPLDGPRLWYANVAIEAVLLGQGVALVNRLQVAPELADGRLVELLDTDVRLGAYVFQAGAERWNEPAVVRLRRWLIEALAATAAEHRADTVVT